MAPFRCAIEKPTSTWPIKQVTVYRYPAIQAIHVKIKFYTSASAFVKVYVLGRCPRRWGVTASIITSSIQSIASNNLFGGTGGGYIVSDISDLSQLAYAVLTWTKTWKQYVHNVTSEIERKRSIWNANILYELQKTTENPIIMVSWHMQLE